MYPNPLLDDSSTPLPLLEKQEHGTSMKKFSFRLDRVLGYRKHMVKRAQRDLFRARREYARREHTVQRLTGRRREIARACSQEGLRGIYVAQYQIYRSFLQKLDHDLDEAQWSLKKEEKEVKAQEVRLTSESIKKKSLEALKDSQMDHYMRCLGREEQKNLDELVVMRRKGEP
jgi:flagellar export protein FliJ